MSLDLLVLKERLQGLTCPTFMKTGKLPRMKHVKKRIPEAEAESFSSDKSCFVARVTDSNLREDTLVGTSDLLLIPFKSRKSCYSCFKFFTLQFLPRKFSKSGGLIKGSNKIVLVNEEVRTWTLILKFRHSSTTFYMRGGWRSFCRENGLKLGDSVTFKLESNNMKTPLLRFSTADLKSVSTKDCNKGKRNKSGDSSQKISSSSSSVSEHRFVTLTVTPSSLKHGRLVS